MGHNILFYRLKTFIRTVTSFVLALATILFLTVFIFAFNETVGGVFALVLTFSLLILFNFRIGLTFLNAYRHKFLLTIPVIFLSLLLLFFKVMVDETSTWGCMTDSRLSEISKLFNYLGFFFWTSFLIWEVYYYIITRKIRHITD